MNLVSAFGLSVLLAAGSGQSSPGATAAATASAAEACRFRIGQIEAVSLSDGTMRVPNDNSLLAVDRPVSDTAALLAATGLPADMLDLSTRPLLLRTGGRRILIDAGAGAEMGPAFGRLPTSMKAAGIDPASVTDVLISHAHPDHVAGLLGAGGARTFTAAAIHIAASEWAAMTANVDMAALVAAIQPKVRTFEPGETVLPGIRAVPLTGHTTGHSGFEIGAGRARLLYVGDALIHPVISVRHPEWKNKSDGDSAAATAQRSALLGRAADGKLTLYGVHFACPGLGRIMRDGRSYRWIPSE